MNDGLSRLSSVLLKLTINTLGIVGTLVFADDGLPFIHLENTDEDSIHIMLLLSKEHHVVIGGWDIIGI